MGKVTLFTHKNNAQSEVANDPLAQAGVTLNVTTGEGANFPSTYPFRLTIWDKAMDEGVKDVFIKLKGWLKKSLENILEFLGLKLEVTIKFDI